MFINLISNLDGQYSIPKDFDNSYFSEICSLKIDILFDNLGEIIDKEQLILSIDSFASLLYTKKYSNNANNLE